VGCTAVGSYTIQWDVLQLVAIQYSGMYCSW